MMKLNLDKNFGSGALLLLLKNKIHLTTLKRKESQQTLMKTNLVESSLGD